MTNSNDFQLFNLDIAKQAGNIPHNIAFSTQGKVIQSPRFRSIYGQHKLLVKTLQNQPDFVEAEFFNLEGLFMGENLSTTGYIGYKHINLTLNISPLNPASTVEYNVLPGSPLYMPQYILKIIIQLPQGINVSNDRNDYTIETTLIPGSGVSAESSPFDYFDVTYGANIQYLNTPYGIVFDLTDADQGVIKTIAKAKSLASTSVENTVIIKGTYLLT